jgi:hypothetical protein
VHACTYAYVNTTHTVALMAAHRQLLSGRKAFSLLAARVIRRYRAVVCFVCFGCVLDEAQKFLSSASMSSERINSLEK